MTTAKNAALCNKALQTGESLELLLPFTLEDFAFKTVFVTRLILTVEANY